MTKSQQAQQGSVVQQNRSNTLTEALKSKDASAIEQALADSLTDGGLQSSTSQQQAISSESSNSTSSAAVGHASDGALQKQPRNSFAGMLGMDKDDTPTDANTGRFCC